MTKIDTSEILYYGKVPGEGKRVQVVSVSCYPGGEPLVVFPHSGDVERVLLRPASMLSFVAAMFWVDALVERGHQVPELVLPFVPGARQDRLNPAGDYLFTAKSVAKMINARNFSRVTVVDPHSEVTPALIDRCHVIHVADLFPTRSRYDAVISPDAGAEKRALGVAKLLGVPLVHAWKTRNVKNGGINGSGIESSNIGPGRHALVVDDICDGGATFVGLGEVLKESAWTADLFVTHGVFSMGVSHLQALYGSITCTDSVIGPWAAPAAIGKPLQVEVIEVCRQLLEGGNLR
jgi:ribose-phosphate pyrophosphokinase